MAIRGDFNSVRLPDIVQLLNSGQNSGVLHLRRQQWQVNVVFIRGEILEASSTREEYRLEHFLIQRGYLPSDELSTLDTGIAERGRAFEEFIRNSELMSPDDLVSARQELSREIIYDLFSWNEGDFEFDEKVQLDPQRYASFSPLNIYQLIMEGVRRIDEWQRIREVIDDEGLIFDIAGGDERAIEGLNDSDLRVLSLVNGQRSVRDVCLKNPASCFDTCHTLYSLYSTGLIMIVGKRSGPSELVQPEQDSQPHVTGVTTGLIHAKGTHKKWILVTTGLAVLSVVLLVSGMITSRFLARDSIDDPGPDTLRQTLIDENLRLTDEDAAGATGSSLVDGEPGATVETFSDSRHEADEEDRMTIEGDPKQNTDEPPIALAQPDPSGRTNINSAPLEELVLLPRIGPKLAERIIDWRDANGGFKRIEDLMEVSGIGVKTYEQLEDRITVGP